MNFLKLLEKGFPPLWIYMPKRDASHQGIINRLNCTSKPFKIQDVVVSFFYKYILEPGEGKTHRIPFSTFLSPLSTTTRNFLKKLENSPKNTCIFVENSVLLEQSGRKSGGKCHKVGRVSERG
jgi:hypothetical protein